MSTATLVDVLGTAQARGFLGPGPVGAHIEHAERLATLVGPPPPHFLDLGAGAGVPGLVLAGCWPGTEAVLVDVSVRRCQWLELAVDMLADTLGDTARVSVRCGRAEDLAREPGLRESFPLVVARAFGAPSPTAECAVGFLEPGGSLVVSEPPPDRDSPDGEAPDRDERDRWSVEGLRQLGLGAPVGRRAGDVGVVVVTRTSVALDPRWPRRVGVPAKRPIWKPGGGPRTS